MAIFWRGSVVAYGGYSEKNASPTEVGLELSLAKAFPTENSGEHRNFKFCPMK